MIAILTLYGMYVIAEQSVKFLMFNVDALPYLDGILFYCYFIFTYLGNRYVIYIFQCLLLLTIYLVFRLEF